MATHHLYVVRRCDGFYRFWHDVTDPAPMREAYSAYSRLTRGGTCNTTPDDAEYFELCAADPLPGWPDGPAPLLRRLHRHDAPAIAAHLLGLNADDRRLRFFRESTDAQILAYVRDIDWNRSLLLGAVRADRLVGIVEALFDRAGPPKHAEIAVSVDLALRGRGLGHHLVARAVEQVELLGARDTSFAFLRENRPIQRIVRALGGMLDMEDLLGTIRLGGLAAAAA
jgi:GNAT superfamily N-acetyltransferase